MILANGIINFCEDAGVLKSLLIIKTIIHIIFILVPVALVVVTIISLVKVLLSGDDIAKEQVSMFIKRVVIAVLIFVIPSIINAILNSLGTRFPNGTYLSCYNNATKEKITYYENLEKQRIEKEEKEKQEKIKKIKEEKKQQEKAQGNSNTKNNVNYTPNHNIKNNVYIGDSRTVGMYNSVYGASYQTEVQKTNGDDYWHGSGSKGINWFTSTGVHSIDNQLANHNANVIIQMGTNDLYSHSAPQTYIDLISQLASKYPNSNFVVVSVNPIEDAKAKSYGYSVNNNQVISFNDRLKNALNASGKSNIIYCDTYSKIVSSGNLTFDGIHYNVATNKTIYNEINKCNY